MYLSAASFALPLNYFILMILFHKLSSRNIVIIVSMPYNISSASDMTLLAPAMSIAVDTVNRRYNGAHNISVEYVYDAKAILCQDVSMETAEKMSQYYYKHAHPQTCYAFVATSK